MMNSPEKDIQAVKSPAASTSFQVPSSSGGQDLGGGRQLGTAPTMWASPISYMLCGGSVVHDIAGAVPS